MASYIHKATRIKVNLLFSNISLQEILWIHVHNCWYVWINSTYNMNKLVYVCYSILWILLEINIFYNLLIIVKFKKLLSFLLIKNYFYTILCFCLSFLSVYVLNFSCVIVLIHCMYQFICLVLMSTHLQNIFSNGLYQSYKIVHVIQYWSFEWKFLLGQVSSKTSITFFSVDSELI